MLKRVYVWRGPVRVTHWINAFSFFTLAATGLYIAFPYIHSGDETSLVMARMRYVHFISAYIFTASFLVRIYWWFSGRKYGRFDQFIPLTSERWKNLVDTALFYTFVKKHLPPTVGHTALAGLTYLIVFILFAIEILTGFALYSISNTGVFFTLMGGWLIGLVPLMTIRLIHHLVMWGIFVFVVFHIYIVVFNDWVEKDELLMSIFSGYKIIDE